MREAVTRSDVWDRHAARYDAATAWLERRFLAAGRRWVCSRAAGRTLEVGVGTGTNLPLYGERARVVALDASAGMLTEARAKAAGLATARAAPGPAGLLQADAGHLPFADEEFDSVVSTYVLCCVPDLPRALAEMVRVLRPGGSLLLADHVVSTSWPVRLGQRTLELLTVPLQGEHFTRRPLPLVQELGLTLVDSRRSTFGALEVLHART